MYAHDLIRLDNLSDLGMSEMIGEMRQHVQEVARYTTLVALNLRLSSDLQSEFENDCRDSNLEPDALLCRSEDGQTGFSQEGVLLCKIAAKVHDIGKPLFRNLYSLPRQLTGDEFEEQKLHVNFTRLIVKSWLFIRNFSSENLVHFVANQAAAHHERWDGKGYPDGTSETQTGVLGRILAVTDSLSALVLARPYKDAVPLEESLARLERDSGTQFDARLLTAILSLLRNHPTVASQITGQWTNQNDHSPRYTQFLSQIDLEKVQLVEGDQRRIDDIRHLLGRTN